MGRGGFFSRFVGIFFFFVSTVWIFIQQVTENRSGHTTVYWFEERGMKITLWDWCLCLYMTFTALHFISHSASSSPFPSPFPSSEHHSALLRGRWWWCWWWCWWGGRGESRRAYKRGVLGQAGNAGKDVSRWLWKRGNGAEAGEWNPGGVLRLSASA